MRRALVGLVMVASGCLAAPERGTPLYTAGAAAVPVSGVARLDVRVIAPSNPGTTRTFIEAVDGRDVMSLPGPFELLPGCHVILTALHVASTKIKFVYQASDTATHVFPIRMRAGHDYTVVETWTSSVGPIWTLSVHAQERDVASGQTQRIEASTNAADLQACRAWTPPTS
jgi:hypothetical protein